MATDAEVPRPPFFGTRVVRGIPLAEYAAMLDERATFMGQWGLRGARGGQGPTYEELVETEGRPRLRAWLDRLAAEKVLEAAVVYGYFPCYSEGNEVVVLDENGHAERARFRFASQRVERRLCLADFFRPRDSDELDVVALQLVTIGTTISEYTAKLFAQNAYRDYLEAHGPSWQLTEALAEYWHKRSGRCARPPAVRSLTRPGPGGIRVPTTAAAGTRSVTPPVRAGGSGEGDGAKVRNGSGCS